MADSSTLGGAAQKSTLPLRHALALGAVQGPAELLPVSSSGHLVLVPWLAGWPYASLDPELRKSFEVALHAGTAAALLIGLRREVADYAREFSGRNLVTLSLSFAPAALAALRFERPIERSRRLFVDTRLDAADLRARAQPVAATLRRLQGRARGGDAGGDLAPTTIYP